jgi:hypothetical protein
LAIVGFFFSFSQFLCLDKQDLPKSYQIRTKDGIVDVPDTNNIGRWPENGSVRTYLAYQIRTKDGIVGVPDTNNIGS